MTIPIIPDKSYKLFIYIGLGLLIYSFIFNYQEAKKYEDLRVNYNIELKKIEIQLNNIKKDISETDILKKENTIDFTYKKLFIKYDSINQKLDKIKNLQDESSLKRYELENVEDWLYEIDTLTKAFAILGGIILLIGLISWFKSESFDEEIKKRANLHLPTYSEFCQSCGVKFNSINKYGTENNETKNYHFCSNCYENGEFKNPDITIEEIKEIRRVKLSNKNKNEKFIKNYLQKIEELERWK